MEYAIIRPPLIYGPGVKANLRSLINAVKSSKYLPFRLLNEKRSFVYVDNLVDFIINVIKETKVVNSEFFVTDNDDLSLYELVSMIRSELSSNSKIIPIPRWALYLVFCLMRKRGLIPRLLMPLTLNIERAKKQFNWSPPYSVSYGYKKTLEEFKK